MMKVDYTRCPEKPANMEQRRYEDLCHLFASCGYDSKAFLARVEQINRSGAAIAACYTCGKVDINRLSHWRECNPEQEQLRRDAQEVYWK